MSEDCAKIRRKLGRYIDNEVSPGGEIILESHLKGCTLCAVEKETLEKLTAVFRQIPDIIPAEHSEELFWEKVRQAEKHGLIEKIRSLITQWDFMPVFYPAAALLLFGMVMGIAFSKVSNITSDQERLHPSAIEYLALNRMDAVQYNSFTAVYGGGVHSKEEGKADEK